MESAGDHRPALRALSAALRDVHRSLIDVARADYEVRVGPVRSKGALLELLLRDPSFAWLRPLSGLIVEIDELAARTPPPTAREARAMRTVVESLISSTPGDAETFGSRYVGLLPVDPHVAMSHMALRNAIAVLPDTLVNGV